MYTTEHIYRLLSTACSVSAVDFEGLQDANLVGYFGGIDFFKQHGFENKL